MKLCKDCRYYNNITICTSPHNGVSLLDGEPKPKFAITNRNYDTLCGSTATWFAPKIKLSKPWYKKLWRLFDNP